MELTIFQVDAFADSPSRAIRRRSAPSMPGWTTSACRPSRKRTIFRKPPLSSAATATIDCAGSRRRSRWTCAVMRPWRRPGY